MEKLFFYLVIGTVLFASCMNEKGNYSYDEINQISVDNIKRVHEVLQFESPDITPVITQSFWKEEANLEYLWVYEKNDKSDTLCTHRNFDVPVNLKPDIYHVAYYVIDKNTGIFTKKHFLLEVKSALGEGLLVLSDLNGEANLTYIYDGKVLTDIEKTIPGGLGKNPVAVYFIPKFSGTTTHVAVMCRDEQGGTILDGVTLTKEMNYADYFAMPLDVVDPQGYIHSQYRYKCLPASIYKYCADLNYDFICNHGKIHERYIYGYVDKMNAPYNTTDEKGYEASPWMMTHDGYNFVYIYDRKNHRFLQKYYYSNNQLEPAETYEPSNAIDPADVGENMELIFSDAGYVNSNYPMYYLIFKAESKYYCVRAWIYGSYFLLPYKDEITADINEETCFGVHLMAPSVYFSIGDQIYNFDAESKTTLPRWSAKGKKITCIKAEPYIRRQENGQKVYDHMRLYVGVSDHPKDGKTGSVYILRANNDNSLEEITHYNNIAGEIKSFTWKW